MAPMIDRRDSLAGDAQCGLGIFQFISPTNSRVSGRGVFHVVLPEDLRIANIAPIEFGTIPAIEGSHCLLIPIGEIFRAAALNVIDQKRFRIVDLATIGLGAKPAIERAQCLGQLQPNSKLHGD